MAGISPKADPSVFPYPVQNCSPFQRHFGEQTQSTKARPVGEACARTVAEGELLFQHGKQLHPTQVSKSLFA